MTRSFAALSTTEAAYSSYIHRFPTLLGGDGSTVASTLPTVKSVPGGYIHIGGYMGGDRNWLSSSDGRLEPKIYLSQGQGPSVTGQVFQHSDILLFGNGYGSTLWYGMNLKQNAIARNINSAPAAPGIIPSSPSSTAGYGWVSMPALSNGWYQEGQQYQDARYLVNANTIDTTYPTVISPSAPTCTPATSGGKLADGTYGIKIAWVTRLNTRRTGQGITIASPETTSTVSGASGLGRIDVTIPALPLNVIGYVVFVGVSGGPWYAAGGGCIAGTHTIKTTIAQLGLSDKLFYVGNSNLSYGTIVNLENSSPVTWGATPATTTAKFMCPLWSPFFKDPSILYMMPAGLVTNTAYTLKADKWDITVFSNLGMSLNQNVTANGEPCFINYIGNLGSYGYVWHRSIPEMMAYATGYSGWTATNSVQHPTYIQIRSCLNNEILWTYAYDHPMGYNASQGLVYMYGFFDFETIDGATDLLIGDRQNRGVRRVRVICWS